VGAGGTIADIGAGKGRDSAGFELARTAPAPAADRFLLVFRKAAENASSGTP